MGSIVPITIAAGGIYVNNARVYYRFVAETPGSKLRLTVSDVIVIHYSWSSHHNKLVTLNYLAKCLSRST